MNQLNTAYLNVSPEVALALKNGEPVVALESTIISHGMPYPENVESAQESERTVRAHGAVPATVGIRNGRIVVGLSEEELHHFGQDSGIAKASRRDLPVLLAQGRDGATTVATTMMGAAMAGIRLFATGGIGGVHRGAQQSFDISADLQELARTDVAVVCAGAKSILDIGLTLEVLETLGVPVLGYQTDAFPAFYTRDSGFGVDCRVDSAAAVAHILHTKWTLGLSGGVVVGNPIPEVFEMEAASIQATIEQALAECTRQGITGKRVTPFLLATLHSATGNSSLTANKHLVYHNCAVAAQIAVAYALEESR